MKLDRWKRPCAVFMLWAATAVFSPAQTFTTLVNFDWTNGASPLHASLIQGSDGLYGTTTWGGTNNRGTVMRITASGLTTRYNFCAENFPDCTDGSLPQAPLMQAADGYFYGTTSYGGAQALGMIFKINAAGKITTFYNFCSQTNCTDGNVPFAGLIQATDGNFYGTTSGGGTVGLGTVFRITPAGALTTLYSFCAQTNCADGRGPVAALVQGTDGNFYGTTGAGGTDNDGTVFKITAGGTLTTLHSFNSADGELLAGALVQGTDGNFYGTTPVGGLNGGGTVFRITPAGTLTTIYNFCAQTNCTDGADSVTELVQATDGNFYGTTVFGGASGDGTLFKITPGGTLTTLHSFDNTDGEGPSSGLVQATNGDFYGSTTGGGASGGGTVFSLAMGLHAFVETRPASGRVGASVQILGTNLTGASSVSFNGTAATFEIVSRSVITTTVPAGATTGLVTVKTPGGTLDSNVEFRVAP